MTIEGGTHSVSQNVIGKFILHTVQNPQNLESVFKLVVVFDEFNVDKLRGFSCKVAGGPELQNRVRIFRNIAVLVGIDV
jgi:hypothetical protein